MLNRNKVSEIKIIISGLLQDLDKLANEESVSPVEWEELTLAADNIKSKINSLMFEQQRENILRLNQTITEFKCALEEQIEAVQFKKQEEPEIKQEEPEIIHVEPEKVQKGSEKRNTEPERRNVRHHEESQVFSLFSQQQDQSESREESHPELNIYQEPEYEQYQPHINEPVANLDDASKVILESDEDEEEEFELFYDGESILRPSPENRPSWMTDEPGPRVEDLNDAITLNDKLFFIRGLFNGDSEQYRLSLQRINEMTSMSEALEYTRTAFDDWDEDSEEAYRFYMILRRKLR